MSAIESQLSRRPTLTQSLAKLPPAQTRLFDLAVAVAVACSYLCTQPPQKLVISTEAVRSHRTAQWRDPRILPLPSSQKRGLSHTSTPPNPGSLRPYTSLKHRPLRLSNQRRVQQPNQ